MSSALFDGRTAPAAVDGAHAWRVVGFAAVMFAMTAPGQTLGVSVFVDPMIADLGLSRSAVSTAYLVGTLTGAVLLPRVGRLIDRRGVRFMAAGIAIAFGFALVAMAGVGSLVALGAGFVGIRLLGQGSLSLTASTAVTLWFDRGRGTALGVQTAVGGALMSLAPLAMTAAIGQVGWRWAWVLASLAVWAVLLPIAAWGLRGDRGMPGPHHGRARSADRVSRPQGPQWTRPQALRTSMFWTVTIAVATSGMITTALAFHQISLLGERGLSPTQAAANFLPQTAATIVATLAMGVIVDRVAPPLLVAASMGSLAAALVLAHMAAPGPLAVAFGMAVGAANGSIRTLGVAAFPRYFGVTHIGAIRGVVLACSVGGTAFGPIVLAAGFERFGSYGPVLSALLTLPVAVALAALFARVPDAALHRRISRSVDGETAR